MPRYDYDCVDCGSFEGWASMSRAAEPMPCPVCSGSSRRVICAPSVMRMSAEVRNAMNRNERAAHEPRMSRRSCESADPERRAAPALRVQTKISTRPWMLGR